MTLFKQFYLMLYNLLSMIASNILYSSIDTRETDTDWNYIFLKLQYISG